MNDLEGRFPGPKNTAASKIFMQAVNKLSGYVSNKFSFSLICEQ